MYPIHCVTHLDRGKGELLAKQSIGFGLHIDSLDHILLWYMCAISKAGSTSSWYFDKIPVK